MAINKTYIKAKDAYKVTFEIPNEVNPKNKEIRLLGEFNDWNWAKAPALQRVNGCFKTSIELPAGTEFEFRYKTVDEQWFNDWAPDAYVPSPHAFVDNCVVKLAPAPKAKKASTKTKAAPVAKTKAAPVVKAKATPQTAPVAKAKAAAPVKGTTEVNFTKIEGIGPKIAQLIAEAGISTYAGLGDMKKKDLQAILALGGKRYAMHDPTTWPKQAKLLDKGKLKELKKLQDELKGGKNVK